MRQTLMIVAMSVFMCLTYGCPANNQTITQQMVDQGADPSTVAMATYADALTAYVDAQELYLPYQEAMRESDPEIDKKIIEQFRKARKVLDRWKLLGTVSADDKDSFRDALRQISIELAKSLEEK